MFGWRVTLWAVLVAFALYFLFVVRAVAIPFAFAFLVAAILDPIVRRLHRRGVRWGMAVTLVWSGGTLLATALAIWLVPIATRQIVNFTDKTEEVSRRVSQQTTHDNYFVHWNPRYLVSNDPLIREVDEFFAAQETNLRRIGLPTDRRLATSQYIEPFRKQTSDSIQDISKGLLNTLGQIGSNMVVYVFIPLIVLFILQDLEKFKERSVALIPPSIRSETVELISDVFNVFINYLRGMALVLLYYLVISAITLSVLGAPYSLLLAVIFTAIYLVPMVGGFFNALLLLALTGTSGKTGNFFMHFDNPWVFALVIAIMYAGVFTLFDPLVTNRVVGKAVGLSPVLSFFVVFSLGKLFGPIGMVFAFPMAGAAKIIIDRLLIVTSKSQDLQLPVVPLRHRET